ncbi:MAG: tRNA dihydrouridine synthase DusB [Clostridiales bacterium]|nr:tRNA dihydrouridine synthase DusB [Clostridiales bacterium]
MRIGGVTAEQNILLAPMAGVTDTAFRIVCREVGAKGFLYTEMVSAKGLCYGDRKSFELTRVTRPERPAAIQIFGADPLFIAKAVELLCESDADLIDINMGCPMPKITKNGEGSALMLDPARAAAVVRAAAGATKKPVTVKIRKGWDAARANAVEFAKAMEAAGAAMIAVHGRTREQMYGGRADWDVVARVKRAVGVPVVGNGDVFCAGDALRMLEQTGCDGVMIGRGARGNPWIFRGIAGAAARRPAPAERLAVMRRHLILAVAEKGEHTGVLEMRKHLAWYVKGMHGAAAIKNEIFRLTSSAELLCRIDQLGETL